jgi:hypothetical protein
MTKGLGVGTEMFGETKGDLLKPGMTQADLDAAEKRTLDDSADPFAEIWKERQAPGAAMTQMTSPPPGRAMGPLPDQATLFYGGHPPQAPFGGQHPYAPFGGQHPQAPFAQAPLRPSGGINLNPEIKPGRFKIEMCKFFLENKCARGTNCTYAHSEGEIHQNKR